MSYNSEGGSEVGEEKTETVLLRGFLLLVGQRCSDELTGISALDTERQRGRDRSLCPGRSEWVVVLTTRVKHFLCVRPSAMCF